MGQIRSEWRSRPAFSIHSKSWRSARPPAHSHACHAALYVHAGLPDAVRPYGVGGAVTTDAPGEPPSSEPSSSSIMTFHRPVHCISVSGVGAVSPRGTPPVVMPASKAAKKMAPQSSSLIHEGLGAGTRSWWHATARHEQ